MKKLHLLIACSLVLTFTAHVWTQQLAFTDVKARFSKSATNRSLVSKDADLVLDDTARVVVGCLSYIVRLE